MENLAKIICNRLQADSRSILFETERDQLSRRNFLDLVKGRQALLKNYVNPADHILVGSSRSYHFLVDIIAVMGLGGVIVPFDGDAPISYIKKLASISQAKLALTDLKQPIDGLITIESSSPDKELTIESDLIFKERNRNEASAIFFTSGTTGEPKGVILSARTILGNAEAFLKAVYIKSTDRLFINIPFHFTSAICHQLYACLTGATVIGIEEKVFHADFIKKVSEKGATIIGGAPMQIYWLSQFLSEKSAYESNLPLNVRAVISSGDHLPVTTIVRLRTFAPEIKIYTVYGLTEVGGRFCILPPEKTDQFKGSVGKPIDGFKMTIRDAESSDEIDSGELGEVYISGDYIFDGYYKNEAATKDVLSDLGFRTGDLGFVDDHGMLWLKGRADDVFKVSGQKVSANLIVDVLTNVEAFKDVAVLPKKTELFGVVPVAIYVAQEGMDFQKGQILRDLRKKLPTNHLPREFIEVTEIPRTGSGKVKKSELRRLLFE